MALMRSSSTIYGSCWTSDGSARACVERLRGCAYAAVSGIRRHVRGRDPRRPAEDLGRALRRHPRRVATRADTSRSGAGRLRRASSYVVSKLLDERGGGGFLPRPLPMVIGRSERVNPAARTVAPAPTTSPSRILRSAEWSSKPAPRCFRVDPTRAFQARANFEPGRCSLHSRRAHWRIVAARVVMVSEVSNGLRRSINSRVASSALWGSALARRYKQYDNSSAKSTRSGSCAFRERRRPRAWVNHSIASAGSSSTSAPAVRRRCSGRVGRRCFPARPRRAPGGW
jgi:hypothetical protein